MERAKLRLKARLMIDPGPNCSTLSGHQTVSGAPNRAKISVRSSKWLVCKLFKSGLEGQLPSAQLGAAIPIGHLWIQHVPQAHCKARKRW